MGDDWMREDARIAKQRNARRLQDEERRARDLEALKLKGPDLWARITSAISGFVDRFNQENQDLRRIECEATATELTLTFETGPRVAVSIDYGRELVECIVEQLGSTSTALADSIPEGLSIKVSASGNLYIVGPNGRELTDQDFAKVVLRPIFRAVG